MLRSRTMLTVFSTIDITLKKLLQNTRVSQKVNGLLKTAHLL
jgi:hypothetical protein